MAFLNDIKIELTQEQLQSIKDEFDNDPEGKGYSDKSVSGKVILLDEKPLIENPTPQGNVPVSSTIFPTSEILSLISWDNLKKSKKHEDGNIAWDFLFKLDEVDLTQANIISALADLLENNLISQDELNNLNAKIAPIPDPNWQAQIPGNSRTEEILGIGYKSEGIDIRAAQAL